MTERSDWFATAHGHDVWLLEPDRSVVCIEDIALSLARQCRFAGHYKPEVNHYSVAQHSVIVSHAVPAELALAGLLHDASEAYLQDIVSPLKRILGVSYRGLESAWSTRINRAFGLADFADRHEDIKRADTAALGAEIRDLLLVSPRRPPLGADPLPATVVPWDARTACALFLQRFHVLYAAPAQERAPLPDFNQQIGEKP
jgi:hypothetical protein